MRISSEIARVAKRLATTLEKAKDTLSSVTKSETCIDAEEYEDCVYKLYQKIAWALRDIGYGEEGQSRYVLALAISLKTVQSYNELSISPLIDGSTKYDALLSSIVTSLKRWEHKSGDQSSSGKASANIPVYRLQLPQGCPWSVAKFEKLQQTLEEWSSRARTAAVSYRLTGLNACLFIMRCLEGVELLYAQQCMRNINEKAEDAAEELLQLLSARYSRCWSQGRTTHRFENLVLRHEEPVTAFLSRVRECGQAISDGRDLSDKEYRQRILSGIPTWLKARLDQFYGPDNVGPTSTLLQLISSPILLSSSVYLSKRVLERSGRYRRT